MFQNLRGGIIKIDRVVEGITVDVTPATLPNRVRAHIPPIPRIVIPEPVVNEVVIPQCIGESSCVFASADNLQYVKLPDCFRNLSRSGLLTRIAAIPSKLSGLTLLSRRTIWVVLPRPPLELPDTQEVHACAVEVRCHPISVALRLTGVDRRACLD